MRLLLPQVVNAARVLAARPRSKAAQENMQIFKEAWEKQVRLLTESVDDITTIHDFLAVSGKNTVRCVMRQTCLVGNLSLCISVLRVSLCIFRLFVWGVSLD